MKVTNNTAPNPHLIEQTKTDKARESQQKTDATRGDLAHPASFQSSQVEISDKARLMQKATDVVNQTPDVRADRVAQLKKSIADGTYKVNAEAVADKLIEDHLSSDFGKNSL